jgi:putative membrane protein
MEDQCAKRDFLAQDRTHLANERTLLAYWRTALAFLGLGAFLIKFVTLAYFNIFALVSFLFAGLLFVYGTVGYLKYKKRINQR